MGVTAFSLGFAFGGLDVNLLRCSTKCGRGTGSGPQSPSPESCLSSASGCRVGHIRQMPVRFSQMSPAHPPSWTSPDLSAGGWCVSGARFSPLWWEHGPGVVQSGTEPLRDWRRCPGASAVAGPAASSGAPPPPPSELNPHVLRCLVPRWTRLETWCRVCERVTSKTLSLPSHLTLKAWVLYVWFKMKFRKSCFYYCFLPLSSWFIIIG